MDGGEPAQRPRIHSHSVLVGPHRLEATVFGDGGPTVVIEPMLGGDAASWRTIAETLAAETTVLTYDRAPYGASGAAHDHRTAREIAADLHGLLDTLNITGPLVLVGHSAGGLYVRAFAGAHRDQVAAMVLVDSSHEAQEEVLTPRLPPRVRLLEALTVPLLLMLPRRRLGGADRRSVIRELRALKRMRAADRPLAAGALGDRPLVVLTRSGGPVPVHASWYVWHELHADLALLSANHRHVIAATSGHSIHRDDPELVVGAILDAVHAARTHASLVLPSGHAEPAGAA